MSTLTKSEASPGKAEVSITSNPRAMLPEGAPHSKRGAPPSGADVVIVSDPKRRERLAEETAVSAPAFPPAKAAMPTPSGHDKKRKRS